MNLKLKNKNLLIKHNDRLVPYKNEDSLLIQSLNEGDKVTFEVYNENKKRTITQNRALHLFFTHVADNLTNLGITFSYTGLKGLEMEMNYTPFLVKETIWRPIQIALFDFESTTELETHHINKILDILIKFFGDRKIEIHFPSQIDLMIKEFEKNNY